MFVPQSQDHPSNRSLVCSLWNTPSIRYVRAQNGVQMTRKIQPKSSSDPESNQPIHLILSHLKYVRKKKEGWSARCPGHKDKRNSLSIDVKSDGKVLLNCFARCKTKDILSSIGLGMSDLFPKSSKSVEKFKDKTIVEIYEYTDDSGHPLYQVCRTDNKEFLTRKKNKRGDWYWNLGSTKPVLYHLPAVKAAIESGDTIFIAEGEKDVERLRSGGLCATTNPFGANGWKQHYNSSLENAHVVIIPDNDEAGKNRAWDINQQLRGIASSIKILELPQLEEKEDVSDWLDKHGTIDQLLELVEKEPEEENPLDDLLSGPPLEIQPEAPEPKETEKEAQVQVEIEEPNIIEPSENTKEFEEIPKADKLPETQLENRTPLSPTSNNEQSDTIKDSPLSQVLFLQKNTPKSREMQDKKQITKQEILRGLPRKTFRTLKKLIGPIEWMWDQWLPKGLLTILASEPGIGKSALALRIASSIINGHTWPDGTQSRFEPGSSILWCESEAAQSINLSRAEAWKIPIDNIILPQIQGPPPDILLDNAEHRNGILHEAKQDDVKLIVIDSLRGSHQGDENTSDSIRIVMWLARLARETNKPILLTHHLRKRANHDSENISLDRLRGSSAIAQPARVVWGLDTPNPNTPEQKRLSVIKSNIGGTPDPIGFTISELGIEFGEAPAPPQKETLLHRAKDRISAFLSNYPRPAKEIIDLLQADGISEKTIRRAKQELMILSSKKDDQWFWSLPSNQESLM